MSNESFRRTISLSLFGIAIKPGAERSNALPYLRAEHPQEVDANALPDKVKNPKELDANSEGSPGRIWLVGQGLSCEFIYLKREI